MLKVKDSVDLKELEKYGLKPKYDENTGEISNYYSEKNLKFGSISDKGLRFTKTKRKLGFIKNVRTEFLFDEEIIYVRKGVDTYSCYCDFDLLYDLIKDGLVEKVEK